LFEPPAAKNVDVEQKVDGKQKVEQQKVVNEVDVRRKKTTASLQSQLTDATGILSNGLAPGEYTSLSGITLIGDIYLDNAGKKKRGWIFTVDTLTAAASCKVSYKYPERGGTVTWEVTGGITLGAESEMIGSMTSTEGVITLAANAKSGDLTAKSGAINLGAAAHSGHLDSGAAIAVGADAKCGNMKAVGAVTLGAGATVDGQIEAGAAISLGAGSIVKGQSKAGAAITVGAGSTTCALCAGAAITSGAGAVMKDVFAECNLPTTSDPQFCSEGEAPSVCTNMLPERAYKCTPTFKPKGKQDLQVAVTAWIEAAGSHTIDLINTYGDINTWDTSSVKDLSELFAYSTFNDSLSNWNTAAVTDMSRMFQFATDFNQDLSKWKTAKVKNMKFMFYVARVFNGDLSDWNTGAVTTMERMFTYAGTFNAGDLSKWNIANVRNTDFMFDQATAFNQKLCWTELEASTNNMFTGAGIDASLDCERRK
jgi:surface protein